MVPGREKARRVSSVKTTEQSITSKHTTINRGVGSWPLIGSPLGRRKINGRSGRSSTGDGQPLPKPLEAGSGMGFCTLACLVRLHPPHLLSRFVFFLCMTTMTIQATLLSSPDKPLRSLLLLMYCMVHLARTPPAVALRKYYENIRQDKMNGSGFRNKKFRK